MPLRPVQFRSKTPFIRLLIPLMTGIVIQWQYHLPLQVCWYLLMICLVAISSYFFIPFIRRFQFSLINSVWVFLLFFSLGALLTWKNDIRNNKTWFGASYQSTDAVAVTLDEPLVEKNRSFKANASVEYLIDGENKIPVSGKIILYFKKDSSIKKLSYGSQIIFKKSLQEIKNLGNPGGFDYKRYALFQEITHQIYLKPGEFVTLENKNENWFKKFLFTVREKVISIIQKNIPGKKEQGLAEALLIGYKDDLDQNLVQSYTNTGVVHIIAISGMHLALVYWLLNLLFKPLKRKKQTRWLRPVFVILCLWLFSLLAGAQASVIRSAVMFTCIVIGESLSKKTSIYNTLAVSAFILLCYNPYWLWDVGFQLSYAAVLSIVIFMEPIYNLIYVRNRLLDFIWKLNAVSLAAQLLTVPISIYHFHQFPNYFLFTNFVAVPLSSIIVIGEIVLCAVSFIPFIASVAGSILSCLIWLMNTYIERIESLPYSLKDGLQINILQTVLLYVFITGMGFWLMEKMKAGLKVGLIALLGFITIRTVSIIQSDNQEKIIVYNVPQQQAIDLANGRDYIFIGDSLLLEDDFPRNFHLKPSRILNRIAISPLTFTDGNNAYFINGSKKIMLLNQPVSFSKTSEKPDVDLLVLSKNSNVNISKLGETINIKQLVIDGSVPFWKTERLKKDCASLSIPCYVVSEKGAFVMNLW